MDAFTSGSPFTTLSVAIADAVATTVNVVDATAGGIFLGSTIRIDEEIMVVTAISGDATTLTVVRGEDGTTAAPHELRAVVVTVMPVKEEPLVTGVVSLAVGLSSVVLDAAAEAVADRYVCVCVVS